MYIYQLYIQGQVDAYEAIYDEVSRLNDICILDKWFRVDNKPFKAALLNTVKKWSYMFKHYLMEEITNSLKELDEFIKEKDKMIVKEVEEGNYQSLTAMMGHLGGVRSNTEKYDGMFDPIKKKIELLKNYGQEVSDDVYTKLQVWDFVVFLNQKPDFNEIINFCFLMQQLPEKWTNTKKLAMQAKQAVSPLQTTEVANIRRKTASFDVEQYSFREDFRKKAPFIYASKDPYKKIDDVSLNRLTHNTTQATRINIFHVFKNYARTKKLLLFCFFIKINFSVTQMWEAWRSA